MAFVKDPNSDEWIEVPDAPQDAPAPAPAAAPSSSRGWQWELATPSQAPRDGYYWDWQGGWDQNGQGWQEVPIGGWNNPHTDDPLVPANNTSDTNEYGLNWWQARGYESNDIFDIRTGQLKPGWVKTARGYENPAITFGGPGPGPGPGPTGPGPGGNSGSFGDYGGAPAYGGQYGFPQLNLPRMEAPPEFFYEDFDMGEKFAAPDPSEIEKDPSYLWRFGEGQRAVKTAKAAQGVFGTGATMKALTAYGQNMAKTEYGDIYNRAADTFDRNLSGRFGEWNANRSNKLDAYKTNWGVKTDVYDRDVNATQLEFAPKAKWAELQFGRDWDLYKYANDDAFRKWKAQGDWASAGSQPVD